MTIKELIDVLKKFPQDKKVVIDSEIYVEPNYIFEYKPVYHINPLIEGKETIVVISTK